jgi:hypothetical protein
MAKRQTGLQPPLPKAYQNDETFPFRKKRQESSNPCNRGATAPGLRRHHLRGRDRSSTIIGCAARLRDCHKRPHRSESLHATFHHDQCSVKSRLTDVHFTDRVAEVEAL